MRGELCIGSASFLSLVALLLLIFMHVGQINTSTVPRSISMMKVNVSAYGVAIAAATTPDPVTGLYTDNASEPLQQHLGLRNFYDWGLYQYCAYVNDTHGECSPHVTANRLQPYEALTSDMNDNFVRLTNSLIPATTFSDSQYLGEFTRGAYYLLLLGTIATALAFFTGLVRHAFGFFVSTVFAIVGSVFLLIGAVIWTVIVKKAEVINGYFIPTTPPVPLGVEVSVGNGILLAWAAFACLIGSVIPYMISCCTYRG
ncbi:hypothetical protein PHLGIDRAFT_90215 [Phlebiopsis gigantea 11061_1 CR5-6]|uniref:Actin cortical patch SUR7/pH-response regulator pali n=1 Tax=Phlebiopsis gigantea (strain 11061_1 CR5-6) TaxID=745531 RepID=A0A0C3NP77_PHLG1|nr:hypothetical protein PHLGIDRAFT_90215 [Phlebiopsis gigantea 11061_1 CR5-6]